MQPGQPFRGGQQPSFRGQGRGSRGGFSSAPPQQPGFSSAPPQHQQQQQQFYPQGGQVYQGQYNSGGANGGAQGWNQGRAQYQQPRPPRGGRGGGGGGFKNHQQQFAPQQQQQQLGGAYGTPGGYAPGQQPMAAGGHHHHAGGGGVRKVQGVTFTGNLQAASQISSSAISAERNELFVGCDDGVIYIYDTQSGSIKSQIAEGGGMGRVTCITTEPSGWLFAAGGSPSAPGYSVIRAYKMNDAAPVTHMFCLDPAQRPFTHSGETTSICIVGSFVCSAGVDGQIRVWQFDPMSQWKVALELANAHQGAPVTCLAGSPDGQLLISASAAGDIKGWSGSTPAFHWPGAHQGGVAVVGVVASGQVLTSIVSCGHVDNLVKVWNPAGAQQVITNSPKSVVSTMSVVHMQPMGPPSLVVGFNNASLQLIDLTSMSKVGWLDGHTRNSVGAIVNISSANGVLFAVTQAGDVNRFALGGSAW